MGSGRVKCPVCKGRGKRSTMYSEVMDASGPFYDRDVVREIRTITVQCRTCKGTGEVDEVAADNAPLG